MTPCRFPTDAGTLLNPSGRPEMWTFNGKKRVRVTAAGHTMFGATGRIARQRLSDNGAWVDLDEWPHDSPRTFTEGDPSGRENWALLYPDECEPEFTGD